MEAEEIIERVIARVSRSDNMKVAQTNTLTPWKHFIDADLRIDLTSDNYVIVFKNVEVLVLPHVLGDEIQTISKRGSLGGGKYHMRRPVVGLTAKLDTAIRLAAHRANMMQEILVQQLLEQI